MTSIRWAFVVALVACTAETEENGAAPGCAGVELEFQGESVCALADTSGAACPVDSPTRTSDRGVLLCSRAAPDAAEVEGLVVRALQTGRLLALADVVAVRLPREATHYPGVGVDDETLAQVTVANPGGSWFTPDGAAASCVQTFDHLEAEFLGAEARLSAWNRVLCDEPQTGAYQEEVHPVRLTPPGAGTYRLAARGVTTRQIPGPALLVARDGACPEPRPLAECFRGFLFADCGGELPPALWCQPAGFACNWFSGGCPADGYTSPVECAGDQYCPTPHLGWGDAPWERERDMALALATDGSLEAPDATTVECTCDAPPCLGPNAGFCNPALASAYLVGGVEPSDPSAPLGGLVVVRISARGEFLELGDDWLLVLEADPARAAGPRARVCLFQTSDGGNGGPPICARGGEVVMDRAPATQGELAALHGRLRAEFGGEDPQGANEPPPLRIDARF